MAVVVLDTEFNLGLSYNPNKWQIEKIEYFTIKKEALHYALNIDKKYKFIYGKNKKDILKTISQLKKYLKTVNWVESGFFPDARLPRMDSNGDGIY